MRTRRNVYPDSSSSEEPEGDVGSLDLDQSEGSSEAMRDECDANGGRGCSLEQQSALDVTSNSSKFSSQRSNATRSDRSQRSFHSDQEAVTLTLESVIDVISELGGSNFRSSYVAIRRHLGRHGNVVNSRMLSKILAEAVKRGFIRRLRGRRQKMCDGAFALVSCIAKTAARALIQPQTTSRRSAKYASRTSSRTCRSRGRKPRRRRRRVCSSGRAKKKSSICSNASSVRVPRGMLTRSNICATVNSRKASPRMITTRRENAWRSPNRPRTNTTKGGRRAGNGSIRARRNQKARKGSEASSRSRTTSGCRANRWIEKPERTSSCPCPCPHETDQELDIEVEEEWDDGSDCDQNGHRRHPSDTETESVSVPGYHGSDRLMQDCNHGNDKMKDARSRSSESQLRRLRSVSFHGNRRIREDIRRSLGKNRRGSHGNQQIREDTPTANPRESWNSNHGNIVNSPKRARKFCGNQGDEKVPAVTTWAGRKLQRCWGQLFVLSGGQWKKVGNSLS